MTSLVGRDGLRHEIDLEAWVSGCCEWVVRNANDDGHGTAEHITTTSSFTPMRSLGDYRTHYVAGPPQRIADEVASFAPSEEPITCLQCIARIGT